MPDLARIFSLISKAGRPPFIKCRFLENLEDDILKLQIVVYSKLIEHSARRRQIFGMLDRLREPLDRERLLI